MSRRIHLSDLAADEQLLDRLGARSDAGNEPVAVLLAALARHADTPLRSGPPPRRITRRRTLTALTALVVGASGAGVAAAVTQPQTWLTREPSRVTAFEAAPRPAAPEPGLSQLALPSLPAPVVASDGYVLVRDAAGQIVLLPPKVVVEVPVVDAPAPDAEPAVEPVVQQAVAGPGADAQAASSDRPVEASESTTLASGPTAAKTKPAPSAAPGKSKPKAPVDPGTTDETLALASVPADPEPPGQAVAAQRRPSTPGTESGPGVPARPEVPEPVEKPDQAQDPEHADRDDIGKPDGAEKPDEKPADGPDDSDQPEPPADSDKPELPDGPDQSGRPSEPADSEKPDTPEPAQPETPARPDAPDAPEQPTKPDPVAAPARPDAPEKPDVSEATERPTGAEAPATVERPSVPVAPAEAPPAEPAS